MQFENVSFLNLGAIETMRGFEENALVRIPMSVRNRLNERARFIGMDSTGIEAQFVTDAPNIDLTVTAKKPEFSPRGLIRIFKGNFQVQVLELEPGITHSFRLNPPANFSLVNEKLLKQGGYSPDVWRVVFDRFSAVLHEINTHGHSLHQPEKDQLPALNWLAYGSSITNSNLDGYPHFAAAKLRAQVQNKGLSGACHIEKEMVDYLIDDCHFDCITCELGVNMRESFSPEEFEERASYLIQRLVTLQKPALIISTFPNYYTEGYNLAPNPITEVEKRYNEVLAKLVEEANSSYIRLIHGSELLNDSYGLSGDLLHPSAYGHAIIGTNLAEVLRSFLQDLGIKG